MTAPHVSPDTITRLVARDGTLFSADPAVAEEAASFMGWTHLARDAEAILPRIERFADEVRAEGLTDVVLLGMGGSSLAALVLGAVLAPGAPRLHVLDTTSPEAVAGALAATDPATTLFVIASKSGGTIEPNTLYAIFRERADAQLGRQAAGRRFVAITDPGSVLERLAQADDMRDCFLAPPDVGGRYSALTVFGLLPAALIGIDVQRLVEGARVVEDGFADGSADTQLAKSLADGHAKGANKLLIDAPRGLRVFGIWIEQLVAESLGKQGLGVIPVVSLSDEVTAPADEVRFTLSRTGRETDAIGPSLRMTLVDPYDLGGWFVHWEYSTAMAGALIGLNPFDQPNVAEAKDATAAMLAGLTTPALAALAVDGVELTFGGSLPQPKHPERSLAAVLTHALDAARPADYVAILAYLPMEDAVLSTLSEAVTAITRMTGLAAVLEVGPRYLHSTGQLHKGGPDTGLFVMVTARAGADIPVPGREWSLRQLYCAQAEGDFATLAAHGRRVLRVVLADSAADDVRSFAAALGQAAVERGGSTRH